MTIDEARPRSSWSWSLIVGIVWLALSGWAFWSFYNGSAPFETLGIPISQLVLGIVFVGIWLVRRHT